MEKKPIREIKRGEFIRLKDNELAPVWVRGGYDRSSKCYSIFKFEDVNHEIFVKGKREVFTEFEF